jgi:2-desacetyl-2-hydroxyethyl bacteriochlorophyllide A dehydrogenase
MKTLVMYGAGDIRLEERPQPAAGHNQLVVKIDYVGVCGSDLEFYHGHIPPFLKTPLILGHENVGTVAQVGEGVEGFKVGERLICGPPSTCAELCPSCREDKANACLFAFPGRTAGFGKLDGGYAEYLLINDVAHTALVKIPDNVDSKDAVLFDVICVGVHAIRVSRLRLGDNVVVSGAGSVGLPVIQWLKASGANKIIVLDVQDENEGIANRFGATHFINSRSCPDVAGAVKEILDSPVGADIVFECAGVAASYKTCITCVKPGGQMVCVGCIGEPLTLDAGAFHPLEIDFQYSFAYLKEDIITFMDMMAQGRVSFPDMVTGIFSLDEVKEHYLDLKNRKGHIKGLIDPSL